MFLATASKEKDWVPVGPSTRLADAERYTDTATTETRAGCLMGYHQAQPSARDSRGRGLGKSSITTGGIGKRLHRRRTRVPEKSEVRVTFVKTL